MYNPEAFIFGFDTHNLVGKAANGLHTFFWQNRALRTKGAEKHTGLTQNHKTKETLLVGGLFWPLGPFSLHLLVVFWLRHAFLGPILYQIFNY